MTENEHADGISSALLDWDDRLQKYREGALVADLQRSIAFYRDVLGFQLIRPLPLADLKCLILSVLAADRGENKKVK